VKNYDVESIKHNSYENNNLDIFEMIVSTSEPMINWLIESS
jgi:sialic acid synthase SpsE